VSTEAQKALIRRFHEALSNKDLVALAELVIDDWTNHDPNLPPLAHGQEGARQLAHLFTTGFPDFQITIDAIIAGGDLVAARLTGRGTNTGEFLGLPPTGKIVTITATGFFRIEGSKIAENWMNLDALGLMQQLGTIPPMS
jgi:steroid delta-isomerase-like uncharacterized protein